MPEVSKDLSKSQLLKDKRDPSDPSSDLEEMGKKGKRRNKNKKKNKENKNRHNENIDNEVSSNGTTSPLRSRSRSRSRFRSSSRNESSEKTNLQPTNNQNLSEHLNDLSTSSPLLPHQDSLLTSLYQETFPHNAIHRSFSTSNLLNISGNITPFDAGLPPPSKHTLALSSGLASPIGSKERWNSTQAALTKSITAQSNKRLRDSENDLSLHKKPALSEPSAPTLYSSGVEGPFTVFIETANIT